MVDYILILNLILLGAVAVSAAIAVVITFVITKVIDWSIKLVEKFRNRKIVY